MKIIRKFSVGFFVISLFIFFIFVLVGAVYVYSLTPVSKNDNSVVSVVVQKGETGVKVANQLEEKGLIRNSLVFRIYLKLTNQTTIIAPGEYDLKKNMNVAQILAQISKGPSSIWISFPEGLRREQMGIKFADSLKYENEKRAEFLTDFFEYTKDKEGYLFPDTYLVAKDITGNKAGKLLNDTFIKKFGNEYSTSEVIMASLLERETRNGEERPIIAGIIKNRLRIGMPLQIDATVQYVVANIRCVNNLFDCSDWWPDIFREDYKIESAYSTYTNNGLPPHAIANPGRTALEAVKNSLASDYLYYIHGIDGNAHYASTLEEHNQNVQKYLR